MRPFLPFLSRRALAPPSAAFFLPSPSRDAAANNYQKKNRSFGTFGTVEEANLASHAVRRVLEGSRRRDLFANDIAANVNTAKEAARLAASEANVAVASARF